MVDTNVVSQVAGAPLNALTLVITSLVTFGLGATVKPIINNIIRGIITKVFNQLKAGNTSILNLIPDKETRDWLCSGITMFEKKGQPFIEAQLNVIAKKAEDISKNDILDSVIEEAKNDIIDNIKNIPSPTQTVNIQTATTPLVAPSPSLAAVMD